jgi:hypothetical protein
MGIWTLEGTLDGDRSAAVMFDSVTMRAFGPAFDDASEVDSFLTYARRESIRDVRTLSAAELDELHEAWLGMARGTSDEEVAPLLEATLALRGVQVPR